MQNTTIITQSEPDNAYNRQTILQDAPSGGPDGSQNPSGGPAGSQNQPDLLPDERIIELYWLRDEAAITASSTRYGAYCHKIAMAILASEADSEECVNDTWLHSWNAIPPERPSVLKMFFAKITRNLSLDRYREIHAAKRGSGTIAAAIEELEETLPASSDVENEIAAKELGKAINAFLHSVSERESGIFLRRYFYAEEIIDIAARYDMTERNVLVILSRTRKKLKIYLEKEGYTV